MGFAQCTLQAGEIIVELQSILSSNVSIPITRIERSESWDEINVCGENTIIIVTITLDQRTDSDSRSFMNITVSARSDQPRFH